MTSAQIVRLWDAINAVVIASGGNPGNTSIARQRAVVAVESVVAGIEDTIRHGARAACKRLRGERDSARTWRRITETTIRLACRILGDESGGLCELAGNVVAERDAARLELRALEWLALHGYPVGRDPDGGRVMAVYSEADLEPDWHPSWASAARALGWEG